MLQPVGHRFDGDENGACENEWEYPDESGDLCCLCILDDHADAGRDPGEGKTKQKQDRDCSNSIREGTFQSKTYQVAHEEHEEYHEHITQHVCDRAAQKDGTSCHRQRAETIDESP